MSFPNLEDVAMIEILKQRFGDLKAQLKLKLLTKWDVLRMGQQHSLGAPSHRISRGDWAAMIKSLPVGRGVEPAPGPSPAPKDHQDALAQLRSMSEEFARRTGAAQAGEDGRITEVSGIDWCPTVEHMIKCGIPVTRDNWLDINYGGIIPENYGGCAQLAFSCLGRIFRTYTEMPPVM
jgi:hypothetical protein